MRIFKRAAGIGLILWISLAAACQPTPTPAPTQPTSGADAARITISAHGWYALYPQALRETGLQWEFGQPASLWLGDQNIPLWHPLEMSSDTILFYVPEPSVSENQNQVLLLEPGESGTSPAPFLTLESAVDPSLPEAAITADIHLEQDLYYDSAAPFDSPWLWQQLSRDTGFETSFNVSTPVDAGQARITLSLWGITASETSEVDHRLQVTLNDRSFDTQTWDGQGEKSLTLTFPAEWLSLGTNSLKLTIPDGEAAIDLAALNSLDIQYPAALEGCGLPEHFTAAPGMVTLSGCANSIWLADSADPARVWVLDPSTDGGLAFQLPDGESFTSGQFGEINTPGNVEAASLSLPEMPVDELIIVPQAFISTLQPLLELRRGQGLRVETAALEAVENRYTHGKASVLAIQRYLQQMPEAPQYLLLIGDASYSQAATTGTTFLPAPMLRTRLGGWTASDRLFVQPEADSAVPETVIGRIPVRTIDGLEIAINKILAYEQNLPAEVSAAALADSADAGFYGDAEHFLSFFAANDATLLPSTASGEDLLAQPVQVAAYFGHGSLTTWGSANLLDSTQAGKITRPSPQPIVIQFTCLTGFFIHPTVQSLTEALLFNPSGGASAAIAPSSLSLPSDQSFLAAGLAQAFVSPEVKTLGEALRSAWENTPAEPDALEAAYTFILFSDPAMRIRK